MFAEVKAAAGLLHAEFVRAQQNAMGYDCAGHPRSVLNATDR
jgi:hypothetical protein